MTVRLLLLFMKMSLLCFGGGYAMIPLIMYEIEAGSLASAVDLTDSVAIAAMSPGPVAVNLSVAIGYLLGGIPGVFAAFAGIAVPCVILVVLVAVFFTKVSTYPIVQDMLYGLRNVVPGIILYAACKMAIQNGIMFSPQSIEQGINLVISGSYFELKSLFMMLVTFILLKRTKIHPIMLIIASAFIGIAWF